MKSYHPLLVVAVLVLAALACQTLIPTNEPTAIQPPTQPQPVQQTQGNTPPLTEADVPRISVSDAKAALDSGTAVIVDVRSADAFAASHIAGATSIPLQNFESSVQNLSLKKDQWIITYCT